MSEAIGRVCHQPARAWSLQDDAYLRLQWGVESAARIAAAIGKTKNAVIGRAYRIGMRSLASRDDRDYGGFWTAERRQFLWDNYSSNGGLMGAADIAAALGCTAVVVRNCFRHMLQRSGWQYSDSDAPPQLTDADFRGCRWIAGDAVPVHPGMYCGAPVVGPEHAWCKTHRAIAYQDAA